MFEARLLAGRTLKQLIEAIKDLVVDANVDVSEEEMSIQSMDSSHVALVSVSLQSSGFDHYRADRPLQLGFNTLNMAKILKLADNNDLITLKADDDGDSLTLMFESPNNDRIADFELKLMDIDNEQLGIPDTPYKCRIQMSSLEFQRIVRDLQVLGETCTISCTKEGIRFSVQGELGTGNVLTRATTGSGGSADGDKKEQVVTIDMEEPVELNFALRYLNFFTKATSLSDTVLIRMSPDVPIVIEYPMDDIGYVKYYLAPKIDEEGS